jgi:mono/diheme cytochrome c family protein
MEVDNPLVVPVDKKIRMVTTANDVIHAWMVPAFGVKQDAIPGFVRDTWFRPRRPATSAASAPSCAARTTPSCRSSSRCKSEADYTRLGRRQEEGNAALADDPNKEWQQAELQARGEKVYAANCVACHQANGKGVPALPGARRFEVVLDAAGQADRDAAQWQGRCDGAFKQLSDVELAAVITYTRNNWATRPGQHRAAGRSARCTQVRTRSNRRHARKRHERVIDHECHLDHHAHDHDHAHDHAPHGWRRWLYATNHKDIGTMYLWFSFAMFMVGGVNALLLRAELFQPGLQIVNPSSSTSSPRCTA